MKLQIKKQKVRLYGGELEERIYFHNLQTTRAFFKGDKMLFGGDFQHVLKALDLTNPLIVDNAWVAVGKRTGQRRIQCYDADGKVVFGPISNDGCIWKFVHPGYDHEIPAYLSCSDLSISLSSTSFSDLGGLYTRAGTKVRNEEIFDIAGGHILKIEGYGLLTRLDALITRIDYSLRDDKGQKDGVWGKNTYEQLQQSLIGLVDSIMSRGDDEVKARSLRDALVYLERYAVEEMLNAMRLIA